MSNITSNVELAEALRNVASNYKTLYVMGCFGAPMTDRNKSRYCDNHKYNRKPERQAMIKAATADTFGFDCVCLIKGLLWGWTGDKNDKYGGAEYASGGVPDTNADGLIRLCRDVSTDFSRISVGEVLWMSGHVGVYIGEGLAVECTPAWKNCVQITAVHNIGKKTGYNGRKWVKHGKLPYIAYEEAGPSTPAESPDTADPDRQNQIRSGATYCIDLPLVQRGDSGSIVETIQQLLKKNNCDPGEIDGEFGPKTEAAVLKLQLEWHLETDGKVGGQTWPVLLGT